MPATDPLVPVLVVFGLSHPPAPKLRIVNLCGFDNELGQGRQDDWRAYKNEDLPPHELMVELPPKDDDSNDRDDNGHPYDQFVLLSPPMRPEPLLSDLLSAGS